MAKYKLFKDGKFVNTIEADLMFTIAFCQSKGLTYEEILSPETELTPAQIREEAYNTKPIIKWHGEMLTVTQAAQQWQYYAAEGDTTKTDSLTAIIAQAKHTIREQYPDEEVST